MPLRGEVVKALRFFNKNPSIPAKGIRHIAKKLREAEEEPLQTQKYLKSAYEHLKEKNHYKPGHPMLRNINRLSKAMKHASE